MPAKKQTKQTAAQRMNSFRQHKVTVLRHAILEAKRFIQRAEAAISRLEKDSYAHYGCKETASAKRASMDLTNALVEVRR